MSEMNIEGLDKAEVLAALWNASRQQGLSFLDTRGACGAIMGKEEAQGIIDDQGLNLDYVLGRVMKVDLRPTVIDLMLYDRDNGKGAGERAILEALTTPR